MQSYLKVFLLVLLLISCQNQKDKPKEEKRIGLLGNVPATKLSFRLEADVPAPSVEAEGWKQREISAKLSQSDAFFPAVREDFEKNRMEEVLDGTFVSPDGTRILALYHRPEDTEKQYRLDLYSKEGKLIKKITPEGLAVIYFPDTIAWSPDSKYFAFIASARLVATKPQETLVPTPEPTPTEETSPLQTPAQPESTPAFRTEQIYICDSNGSALKPLTQNEGLIHFYLAWSPNSELLLAMALTWREWELERLQAQRKGEIFIPSGRPRVIEKSGRIRLLDDRKTQVLPVWSPDSSKIAAAFNTEICIYDASGDLPTQASIPLRNQLLIASQKYEEEIKKQNQDGSSETEKNQATPTSDIGVTTLPKEEDLVSFNPIVRLLWLEDRILYFQTGYVKEMLNPSESVRSFLRWHRIILSLQG
ncbi:MAG: hypothetical protein N2Z23_02150 [Pyrinomonadaceae bacterium]|nr:hypothetical protein [Pyrinomonadaceae bacterium]MCX7639232.1 hypothetical protein [Pyrinomonadaceae bacterium]MDW8303546.1 hypothetical protein [Acidobacteriota bacterium]